MITHLFFILPELEDSNVLFKEVSSSKDSSGDSTLFVDMRKEGILFFLSQVLLLFGDEVATA